MRDSRQSPVTPLLVTAVVAVIFITAFVWAWAVRRPLPANNPGTMLAATPTATEKVPLTYAAIGASDVVGVGASDPQTESWVNSVHDLMPAGTRLVRLGRSGITLHEANTTELPQAIAAQPDIVTLWNCVNDAVGGVSIDSYKKDLQLALTRLTRETKADVVVLNMPDMSLITPGDAQQRALVQGGIKQWNQAIAETAAGFGERVKIVDLFPVSEEVLQHPEYISPDHFHPSTLGYKRLAQVVWDTIERDHLLNRAG